MGSRRGGKGPPIDQDPALLLSDEEFEKLFEYSPPRDPDPVNERHVRQAKALLRRWGKRHEEGGWVYDDLWRRACRAMAFLTFQGNRR